MMRTAGRERIDRLTARYLPPCVVRLCMKHDINTPYSVTEYCPPAAHVQRFPLNSYFHIWVTLVIVTNAVKELKDATIMDIGLRLEPIRSAGPVWGSSPFTGASSEVGF
jgi:hypothetical protein